MFRRLLVCTAAVLALGGALAHAQNTPVSIKQVSDEGGDLTMVVTLLDAAGRPIPGVPADAFEMTLDGGTVPIRDVRFAVDAQTPLGLVLALDISGSMAGERIALARNAATTFLDTLEPSDQVALLTFNQNVATLSEFTSDRAALKRQIAGLNVSGNTALYAATIAAVEKAAAAPLTRKAVVLVSDGENFEPGGRATREGALDAARRAGVPVYGVGLGAEIDRPYLDDLAQVSRGASAHAPAPADLDRLYRGVSDALRGQYVVTGRPAPVRRAPSHTVRMNVRLSGATVSDQTTFPGTRLPLLPDPTAAPTPAAVATAAPATVAPTVAATPAPTSVAEQQPVAEPASGAGGRGALAPLAVGAGALALIAAAGIWFVRRRRSHEDHAPEPEEPYVPTDSAPVPSPPGAAMAPPVPAVLLVSGGPLTGLQVAVQGEPVTIGMGQDCGVVLPTGGDGVERRLARIWYRDGRFMLHRLARQQPVTMGGQPVQWAILESGDEFAIGPHQFRFQVNGAGG
jgi:VWFA-related protein